MRLMTNGEDGMMTGQVGNFKFSGVRTSDLGASEYTLVNICLDATPSLTGYEQQLHDCLVAAVESCKKSPRADNLLVRVTLFNSRDGVVELHGFKSLSEIDTKDYPAIMLAGTTNLFDAAYASVGSSFAYALQLSADEFPNNVINIVITDGEDNASTMTPGAIKREIESNMKKENTESCINILVGINDTMCRSYLDRFSSEAGFDKYIPAGDVTPAKLAKLADFISQSISSQSQSLGTGGPSQNIAATI